MKFEKLNENKIRITLSIHDLEEKDISFHDFMSNSIENQDLFLDMLEKAEEQIGFKAQDCKIKVEALAMTENDFIVTITKVLPEINKKGAQLIFTSHDLYTMNSSIFRRDEIWFVAKGKDQGSILYSLAEFKQGGKSIRKDASYDKDYVLGKYGADPYLERILDWDGLNG